MDSRLYCCIAVAGTLLLTSCGQETPEAKLKREVLAGLKSADETERMNAVSQVSSLEGSPAENVQYVIKALDDKSAKVRAAAISALTSFTEQVGSCTDKLAELAVEDASADVRMAALTAVVEFAKDDPGSLDAVKEGLSSDSLDLAVHAARTITSTYMAKAAGESAKIAGVVKKGIEAASSEPNSQYAGLDLLFCLADLGGKASAAVPVLEEAMKKPGLEAAVVEVLKVTVKVIKGKGQADMVSTLLDPFREEGRL